jgi:pimeloyl-ACP methyl ester carboxylesterase
MLEFVDRKQKAELVLVPGWAFDCRIFKTLDLPYNYIFARDGTMRFENELENMLEQNGSKKVSMLGWSQGAFDVCSFAAKRPDVVEEIILVGIRKKYEKEGLTGIKKYLMKNSRAYLYKFYKDCFSEAEKDSYSWFKDTLLNEYLENIEQKRLLDELDRLERAQIKPSALAKLRRIVIVHGREDKIAPVGQAADIARSLANSKLIIFDKAGHLPFLRRDFAERLYGC